MSEPEDNSSDKNRLPDNKDEKKESENIVKILDELLTHSNSSRRMFLIFIGCALFFGPAALVLGGVLLGHPAYNIRQLEIGDENAPPPRRNAFSSSVTKWNYNPRYAIQRTLT